MAELNLNWVDILIIIIVSISFVLGLWRGLLREVLSLLALIAGLFIARVYAEQLAPVFEGLAGNETVRYILAFALIFIVVLIAGAILNYFMARLLNITGLKFTDRLLGAGFGFLRGALIVAFVIFFTRSFYAETEWWQESELIPYGVELVEWSEIFVEDFTAPGADQSPAQDIDAVPTQRAPDFGTGNP